MSCPSPDSSTRSKSAKKRKKNKEKSLREKAKKKVDTTKSGEGGNGLESSNAIQNHVVHSTQDIDETNKKDKKFSKLEKELTELKRKTEISSKLLRRYKKKKNLNPAEINLFKEEIKLCNSKQAKLNVKPLSSFIRDKKLLHKELFRIISKKEFKKIMPKNLKRYGAEQVKKFCLKEIEGMSKKRLLAAINNKEIESSTDSETMKVDKSKDNNEEMITEVCAMQEDAADCTNENIVIESEDNLNVEIVPQSPDESHKDCEFFEEIMKVPEQHEIDNLILEEDSQTSNVVTNTDACNEETEMICGDDENKPKQKVENSNNDKKNVEKKLKILELELRARALNSFLKAQERRRNISEETNKIF